MVETQENLEQGLNITDLLRDMPQSIDSAQVDEASDQINGGTRMSSLLEDIMKGEQTDTTRGINESGAGTQSPSGVTSDLNRTDGGVKDNDLLYGNRTDTDAVTLAYGNGENGGTQVAEGGVKDNDLLNGNRPEGGVKDNDLLNGNRPTGGTKGMPGDEDGGQQSYTKSLSELGL